MDVLNVEDKGESVAKGDVEEEEEEENEKDDKNGDEEVHEEGTGRISRARMFPVGHSGVSVLTVASLRGTSWPEEAGKRLLSPHRLLLQAAEGGVLLRR